MPPMRRSSRPIQRFELAAIVLVVSAVAFAVRLAWILRVQSPHDAVYSDMGGYVARADELLQGTASGDPRLLAFYPWGTHVLIALEFAAFGRSSVVGIAVTHALVGALPVACVVLLSARLVESRLLVAGAGLVAALWQPQIAFAGFFMSEIWFTAAITLGAWLLVLQMEKGTRSLGALGSLGAGCAFAAAFVIRPQVLLTCALLGLALAPRVLRSVIDCVRASRTGRTTSRLRWIGRWGLLVAPLLLAIVGSSIRLHRLTGRFGLISENGAVMKLFADTTVSRIEASWTSADGTSHVAWFSPAMNHPVREEDIVRLKGYVGDPDVLERIRKARVDRMSLAQRAKRMKRHVVHLVSRNFPNPEEDFHGDPRRAWLQRAFARATLGLLPLAAIGVFSMRRRVAGIVVIANLVTIVVVAACFYAEARYRVPYDPFLVIAATAGLASLVRLGARCVRAGGRRWVRYRSRQAAEQGHPSLS
jgi:hypothetical protein